ncbi:glycosyltransferase [Vibrio astriarenae]
MQKVCVLMAVYNGSQYLDEQISSILGQSKVDVELYIRLDPSTDNSESIIRRYSDKYENIHPIFPSAPSGSAGQNFFNLMLDVDFESYDYVAFADQDDIWFNNKLSRADESIIEHDAAGYSGDVIAWWESGKQQKIVKSSPQGKYDYLFESAGPGCTFVLRIDLARELKHYLKSLGDDVKSLWLHDWFCYAFARSRGYNWFIDDKPMMKYRQHDSNSVGANSGLSALNSRLSEVLSGCAFDKVMFQASALKICEEKPIQLLLHNRLSSSIRLAFYANQCRRRFVDKLFFALAMIVHAFGRR